MPTLFHGSRTLITSFSSDRVGQGYEANSALGLWLTSVPKRALDYAQGGYVLSVEIPPMRLAMADQWTTTVWGDLQFNQDDFQDAWGMFSVARAHLMAEGYGGVFCDIPNTDLEGAVCVFDPDDVSIGKTYTAKRGDEVMALRPDGTGLVVNAEKKLDYLLQELRPDMARIEM